MFLDCFSTSYKNLPRRLITSLIIISLDFKKGEILHFINFVRQKKGLPRKRVCNFIYLRSLYIQLLQMNVIFD